MMKIDYINGPKTDKIFGMYKYQMEIQKRLNVVLNVIEYQSIMQNLEKRFITPNPANSTVEYREVKNSKFKNSLWMQVEKHCRA